MLRVFLAEDERIIRETLRDTMPWKQCGYIFAGEAGDGEMALPLIRQTRPDVLITDIRMPFMDGLELSRQVLQEFPYMKIIIISGYDDFEFARQAISIGVERYLLKPVTKTMLVSVLGEIRARIEAEGNISPEPDAKHTSNESDLMNLDLSAIDPNVITDFLQKGSAQNISDFCDAYILQLSDFLHDKPFCQYLMLSVRFTASAFVQKLGVSQREFLEGMKCLKLAGRSVNTEELKSYMIELLQRALQLREQKSSVPYSGLLKDAISFMEANFAKPEISLNSVARAVNVSANYLSAVFSQEMGTTFVEYLTAKRMEKARELLLTTDMRSGEIALAVGYKDPHYFSFLFKKNHGCTPRDYRAGKERK